MPYKIHRVHLSNDRVLLVQEDLNSIHIALETNGIPEDVDMYICELKQTSVQVWSNSGDAVDELVSGLKKEVS